MFLETSKDVGKIKIGTTYEVGFRFDNLGMIVDAMTSCDCLGMNRDDINKQVILTYKPKGVPTHLKQAGKTRYSFEKTATLTIEQPDGNKVKTDLKITGIAYE